MALGQSDKMQLLSFTLHFDQMMLRYNLLIRRSSFCIAIVNWFLRGFMGFVNPADTNHKRFANIKATGESQEIIKK